MADNKIGKVPEFTSDSAPVDPPETEPEVTTTPESGVEPTDTGADKGAETQPQPSEVEKTAPEPEREPEGDTADVRQELDKEIEGMREARRELIQEIQDLRGQKREAKQAEIEKVEKEIDKLEDINPDDVGLIERVLRAKGYVAKPDVDNMFREARKQEEISKFFKEFPEYSEDNDPDRRKFGPLLREVSLYKEPGDPAMWATIFRRAHQTLSGNKRPSGGSTIVKKRQAELAGVGAGGAQPSSSVEPFSVEKRMILRQGGWSDEDIQRMEQRASKE